MAFIEMTAEEEKVYRDIAKRLGGPNYNAGLLFPLQVAMNPQQAKVYRELPGSSEEIAEKVGVTLEFVEDTCKELYEKGYVVLTRKSGWQPARSVIQVTDSGPIQKWAEKMGDAYFRAFQGGMGEVVGNAMMAMSIPLLKVIPHFQALEASGFTEEDILPIENIRKLFGKANSIAANYCCCRRTIWGAQAREEGYVCMCFDYMAEYQVKRGAARMVSYEEALEIEEKCLKDWNAITPGNGTYLDALCNCNYEAPCVYEIMATANKPMKLGVAPSRYQSVINPEKCISCQECVQKCKADAVTMIRYPGERKFKAWVDPDKCMGCGCCVVNCKGGATQLICVRPPEFIPMDAKPELGRYDAPEKYYAKAETSIVAREARIKADKKMEEKYCLENGINRDPYRSKMEFAHAMGGTYHIK